MEVPPLVAAPLIPDGGEHVQVIVAPVVDEVKATALVAVFEQTVWSGNENCTIGAGLTVMVNCFVGPEQVTVALVYLGVTMIVAITGVIPILTAVNAAISPEPLAASPIDGVLFVHV
jgi:hypothetical protein